MSNIQKINDDFFLLVEGGLFLLDKTGLSSFFVHKSCCSHRNLVVHTVNIDKMVKDI